MAVVKNLMVRAGADFSELQKELKKAQTFMKSAGKELTSIGKSLTVGLTLPIAGIGAAGIKTASDLQEVQNVVDTAFGQSSKAVDEWSKNTLNQFGLTELQAKQWAGSMRAMLGSSGIVPESADQMSMKLAELAGDFASFYNLDHDTAWEKIRSGISGETEPLKSLGINMSVANMEAYALSQGINTSWKEMTQAEQTTLRYNYLMEQSKIAQGDFNKTQDSFANQLRIVQGSLTALAGELMASFIPTLESTLSKIREGISWFRGLSEEQQQMIVKIGLLVASIGPLLMILGTTMTTISSVIGWVKGVTAAIAGFQAGTTALSGVLTAVFGPAGVVILVIAGIAALVVAIKELWEHNEGFRNAVITAWEAIKATAVAVWDWLSPYLTGIWNSIKDAGIAAFDMLKWAFEKVWNYLTDWWKQWGDEYTAVFMALWDVIKIYFGTTFDNIKIIFETILTAIADVFNIFAAAFRGDWEGVWNGVKDLFADIWHGIVGIAQNSLNGIIGIVNEAISWINKIPGVEIGSMSKVDFSGAQIEKHADGGIFTRPTLWGNHLIGESEPEALVPLDRLAGSGTANIIVELDGYTLARALGQPLTDLIRVKTGIKI